MLISPCHGALVDEGPAQLIFTILRCCVTESAPAPPEADCQRRQSLVKTDGNVESWQDLPFFLL